jgi:hypothetical protein
MPHPSPRRFPPPWSIEELNDACFVVKIVPISAARNERRQIVTTLLLIRTSLHHCRSLFPGNGILQGRDSGAEKARHIQAIVSRDKSRTKTQKFGAICTTPGNLCLYGTAWWG